MIAEDDLKRLHKLAHQNRSSVEKSQVCGCFYCQQIFPASEVAEYIDKEMTALCPRCQIDSVLADADTKLDQDLLRQMNIRWFEGE